MNDTELMEFVKFKMNSDGGRKLPCQLIDAEGNIKQFDSVTDAAEWVSGKYGNVRAAISNISQAIAHQRKAYGFKWSRVDE